jgi:hypothetical protein
MPDDTIRTLWCLVEGDPTPFQVYAPLSMNIANLKELVYEKGIDPTKNHVLAKDLKLWKVSSFHRPSQTLRVALGSLHNFPG